MNDIRNETINHNVWHNYFMGFECEKGGRAKRQEHSMHKPIGKKLKKIYIFLILFRRLYGRLLISLLPSATQTNDRSR